ncbi:hypothetical protein [Brevibacillus sp. NRS-1366]
MGEARRRKQQVESNTYKTKNNPIKNMYIKVMGWISSDKTNLTQR